MQRPDHMLSEGGRQNDTNRDSALVTVFQQIGFDYHLRPDIGIKFEQRTILDANWFRAFISLQQTYHKRDSFIGLLLSDPVCSGIETIQFSDRTWKGKYAARQLIRDFIIDCD